MLTSFGSHPNVAHALVCARGTIDLSFRTVSIDEVPYRNLEDVLGGFGRSFQILAERNVTNAYSPENPLIINTGILTESNEMSALRTFFSAYSPLKISGKALPGAIWSTGSCKFGCMFKWTGVDELVIEGRANEPVLLLLRQNPHGPTVEFKSADHLLGLSCHDKIMTLHREYPDAHFAVIGPAGENYENCYFAGVALSTENQLNSGERTCCWAGRGGMGSLMGYKNLIAIVVQAPDRLSRMRPQIREIRTNALAGPGSRKFRENPLRRSGSTRSIDDPSEKSCLSPQDSKQPDTVSERLEPNDVIHAHSCVLCRVPCHANGYGEKESRQGEQIQATFGDEPVSYLSTDLGIDDPHQASVLTDLADQLGMDPISLGTTLAYVLEYNERHPDRRIFNGAIFGDFERIRELVEATGRSRCPGIGRGVKRLSERLGETSYAMQCKGVELPARSGEINPGYPWAIAGGEMPMAAYLHLVLQNDTSVEHWVQAITERGLSLVRDDMLGLCKFAGVSHYNVVQALKREVGLDITEQELLAAVRRAAIRALWLERKQGYERADYTLPAAVFDWPATKLGGTRYLTPEFFAALSERVWSVFDPEIAGF